MFIRNVLRFEGIYAALKLNLKGLGSDFIAAQKFLETEELFIASTGDNTLVLIEINI